MEPRSRSRREIRKTNLNNLHNIEAQLLRGAEQIFLLLRGEANRHRDASRRKVQFDSGHSSMITYTKISPGKTPFGEE